MSKRGYKTWVLWLCVIVTSGGASLQAQSSSSPPTGVADAGDLAKAPAPSLPLDQQSPNSNADQRMPGRITGTVVDQSGGVVPGAWVRIVDSAQNTDEQMFSDANGQFSLANIVPGPFQITVTAGGFAPRTLAGTLRPGETHNLNNIALIVAAAATELRVVPTQEEVEQDQVKSEEKQRVFGAIPNFYVSYVYNAPPLTSKQKFQLAWKTSIDPMNFAINGVVAGVQQSQNTFPGYGQGAAGYARRYGASYGDFVTGTFIGSAILPSLFKQDPRYFYKGTGSIRSRILYALANSVICKADNGHWQANYSAIVGGLASSGLSNLYYPASDRNSAAFTFEQALIGTGATAASNLLQEFLIRKLIPGASNRTITKPPVTKLFPPEHAGD
jgi:hypothetical protein